MLRQNPTYDTDLNDVYASFNYEDDVDLCLSQTQTAEFTVELTENATTPTRVFPALGGAYGLLYPGTHFTFLSHLHISVHDSPQSHEDSIHRVVPASVHAHFSGAGIPKSVHNLKQVFMDAFLERKAEEHLNCCCCERPIPSRAHGCAEDGCNEGCPVVFSSSVGTSGSKE